MIAWDSFLSSNWSATYFKMAHCVVFVIILKYFIRDYFFMFQDCDRSSAFLIFYVISEAVDTVHELVKSYKHIFLLILFPSFSRFDWFFKIVLGPAFLKRFLGLIV